ncbi:MAG: prepilin-type N-terminal cleavage/methylation domain-containing protein [Bacteroidota bacterium]
MSNANKIPGFTLSEMVVVLLLTTLVVGMAFSVLQLVQRQMQGIATNYEQHSEVNLLRQSLWIDFNQSQNIWYDAQGAELACVNQLREVRYAFHSDYITKGQDTFRIKVISKSSFFTGEPRPGGEIDAIDLLLSPESGGQSLFVYKQNAATAFLNN